MWGGSFCVLCDVCLHMRLSHQISYWLNCRFTPEMVKTTVTTDPLQEWEVDQPQLGFGEESFPQRRFKGDGFPLVDQRHPLCPDGVCPSSLAVLWCLTSGLVSVSRITTGTQCFKNITSVKHNLSKSFSNAQGWKSCFEICSFHQKILRYVKSCFGLWTHQNETWS